MKKYSGFTLLEILLYVVIGGVTLAIATFSFTQLTRLSTSFRVNTELNQTGNSIIEQLQNLLNENDIIVSPKLGVDANNTLVLRKDNVDTTITQNATNITVSYSNSQPSFTINPTGILVVNTPANTLSFEQIDTQNNSNNNISQSVKLKFILRFNKPTFSNFEYEAEKAFETTISLAEKVKAFDPILNTTPTGANGAAYGLRKLAGFNTNPNQLSSTYNGPAIRVRRDAGLDQNEMDIGFNTKGQLDQVALQNFVGYQNFLNYSENITMTTSTPTSLANGGTITSFVGNGTNGENGATYYVHTFTNVGTSTFTPTTNISNIESLVVGGGGGGGAAIGGGGGAGGVLMMSSVPVTSGTSYTISVGSGGASGVQGTSSTAFGATAAGGGTSGTHDSGDGTAGGSGGGAASNNARINQGGGSSGNSLGSNIGTIYGNRGGNMTTARTGIPTRAAGGGGAGFAASDTNSNLIASNTNSGYSKGGDGVISTISGTSLYYGGGGGGGAYNNGYAGNGGLGGGGAGACNGATGAALGGTGGLNNGANGAVGDNVSGGSGGANTGGGGGGGSWSSGPGGAGGSGIVIIRYKDSSQTTNGGWTLNNINTISDNTTAPDGTNTAEKVNLSVGNNNKSITKNTNLTIGSTYTESYYVKANGTYNFVQIAPDTEFSTTAFQNYNLSNGTLGSSSGISSGQANIQNVGNGWYRISLTATANSTTSSPINSIRSGRMVLSIVPSASSARLESVNIGTATDSIFVWGAMRHLGSTLKPYQQTLANANTGDGYITTWYDQSGNNNNAIQTSTGAQPKIVDGVNGIIKLNNKPVLRFDGTDDQLVNTSFNNATNSTAFFVASRDANNRSFMARSTNYATLGTTDLFNTYYLNKSSSVATTGADTKNSLNLYTAIRTSAMNSTLAIGAGSAGNFLNGNMAELIIYDGNKSSNRTTIENNLKDYYGTP